MKKSAVCCLLALVFIAAPLQALPKLPHRLAGVVHAVNLEQRLLVLEPGKKDAPTEFGVIEGRTKLRRDRKPATLNELAAGQSVRLYYVVETGRCIATEVTWTSDATVKPPPGA